MAAKSTHTQPTDPVVAAGSAGGGRTVATAAGWILWLLLVLATAALLAFAPSLTSHAQVQDIVTVPDAPQNLAATPGNGTVTLTWEEPDDDGGAGIVRYEYRHAAGASVPDETAWTSAGLILTVTVSDLTNDTAYAFEARAVNGEGEGEAATARATPSADPAVTVHPEQAAYRFAEDASDAGVDDRRAHRARRAAAEPDLRRVNHDARCAGWGDEPGRLQPVVRASLVRTGRVRDGG